VLDFFEKLEIEAHARMDFVTTTATASPRKKDKPGQCTRRRRQAAPDHAVSECFGVGKAKKRPFFEKARFARVGIWIFLPPCLVFLPLGLDFLPCGLDFRLPGKVSARSGHAMIPCHGRGMLSIFVRYASEGKESGMLAVGGSGIGKRLTPHPPGSSCRRAMGP
jgi:hypothetical protein